MTKPIGAIVLAAGYSSRFGGSKLLAELANGKTVFQQTVERIGEGLGELLIITRPELAPQLQALAPDTTILSFQHADLGMGATLAYASQTIPQWAGCLVCLADMPFIEAATYRQISQQLTQETIVTPIFESRVGNPVAFGSSFFAELAALQGDSGGRKLTRMHPEAVRELHVTDPGILQDIDTPDELARYQQP